MPWPVVVVIIVLAFRADDMCERSQRDEDHDDPDGEQDFHGTLVSGDIAPV
jgi:hypothetical protein